MNFGREIRTMTRTNYTCVCARDDRIHIVVEDLGDSLVEIEISSGKTKLDNFDIFSTVETLFSALNKEQRKNMVKFLKTKVNV